MTKDDEKNKKDSDGLIQGFGDPADAGIDSAHFLNLLGSAEASFLKQQWDTKQPLQQNKEAGPKSSSTKEVL